MLTAQGFWAGVDRCKERMLRTERQAVWEAIKAGAKVVSCGRYYEGGPLVLTVTKPESWQTEIWRERKTLCCTVRREMEHKTLAWVAKQERETAPVQPVSKPQPKGMTNEEIDDAWQAHLDYIAENGLS